MSYTEFYYTHSVLPTTVFFDVLRLLFMHQDVYPAPVSPRFPSRTFVGLSLATGNH